MRTVKLMVVLSLAALVAVMAAEVPFHKAAASGFLARSGDTTLIVDTDVAIQRAQEKYIPLIIWLGGRQSKTIYADRGSFTLVDPEGLSHSMASFSELLKGYSSGLVHDDYSRLEAERAYFEYAKMYYLACKPLRGVSFFPDPASHAVLYEKVELPSRTFFRALIYFPKSEGSKDGTYNLVYDDAKSGTKITVPFALHWAK